MLRQFVCAHVQAAHACAWLARTAEGRELAAAPVERFHLADIFFEAARRGLVPPRVRTLPITRALDAVLGRFTRGRARLAPVPGEASPATGARAELPLACAGDETLEGVWRQSVAAEAQLLPAQRSTTRCG